MILREYQEVAVNAASEALDKHGNTLVVAPTGAGKTIMLSALVGKRYNKCKNVLILQHRDELVNQNMAKFMAVNENITTSTVNALEKNWDADAVFAMVQTLSRVNNLMGMSKLDMVVIDEAHHAIADTYQRVIEQAKKNNADVEIVGFTATPNRGDKKGLRDVFNNCSHQIEIATLINEGFLVKPRTFVIDVGVQDELREVRKTISDFDMSEVEAIMNRRAINKRVVEEWSEKAAERKTVVFCSTIRHAVDLCEEFIVGGVNAKVVTGDTPRDEREQILHDLAHGDVQVVVNVAVLTEGFDAPPVSCVILTRPCSFKSTMVQMIGRGLRTVNLEEFPNVIKKDCIVLDFGTSILTHGSLDDLVNLDGGQAHGGEAPTKTCPECESEVPLAVSECPICGHEFAGEGRGETEEMDTFQMTEVDLMDRSPFRWIDLFGTGRCMAATGFNGFGLVADLGDVSVAVVRQGKGRVRAVSIGTKAQAIAAADDFLRRIEESDAAKKSRRWLDERVTTKQRAILLQHGITVPGMDFSWTKYKAACMISYVWNKQVVDNIVSKVMQGGNNG